MEQINKMFYHFEEDSEFAAQMQALIKTSDVPAIIAAAAEKGFVFTEAEWREYAEWMENTVNTGGAQPLCETELDAVTGGVDGKGSIGDPIRAKCWFHAASPPELKNGALRKRCNQFACKAYVVEMGSWYMCKCWGTDRCIGNWHIEEGCSYW